MIFRLFKDIFALVVSCACSLYALDRDLDQAQVFQWWDDGIISAEEASEMLDLLEEGNTHEACLLAEVYALEACPTDQKKKESVEPGKILGPPHGFISWKGRTDSTGHLVSQRTELRLSFYKFTLRLGSQELLSYKDLGYESHFGQVSTQELHSQIPLDTLWGIALQFPLGQFRLGALLDTAGHQQARISYGWNRNDRLDAIFWNDPSGALQLYYSGLQVALWQPFHQSAPLLKIQIQGSEKLREQETPGKRKKGELLASVKYKTTAYIHGDSLPEESHLSATIQKNKFWGSQTVAFLLPPFLDSRFSANARLMVPLDADTADTRVKLSVDSGPKPLRGSAAFTCLDASARCPQQDYKFGLASTLPAGFLMREGSFTAAGSVKMRHSQKEGFARPHLELSTALQDPPQNLVRATLILPKSKPSEQAQLRLDTAISSEILQISTAVTLRRVHNQSIHPTHGYLQLRFLL